MRLKSQTLPGWTRGSLAVFVVTAMYYVTGRLALLLAIPPGYGTPVSPSSGIALAAVLLCGYRVWPGIVIGSFFLNIETVLDAAGTVPLLKSVSMSATLGLGAAAQAIVGAWLIERTVEDPAAFVREKDVLMFLILGGPVSCMINATVGVVLLVLAGYVPSGAAWFTWSAWWVGDTTGAILFAPLVLVWVVSAPALTRYRRLSVSVPIIGMFSLAAVAFTYAASWEEDRHAHDFDRRIDAIVHALRRSIDECLEDLYATRGLFLASADVDRREFHDFTIRSITRNPGIQALSWNPRVTADERAAFEEDARRAGSEDFEIREPDPEGRMVRAAARSEYVAVKYVEPHGANRELLGFDVSSEAVRKDALVRAAELDQPIATPPIPLIQDRRPGAGFLVFLPVYSTTPLPQSVEVRRRAVRGFVVGMFQITELMAASLRDAMRDGIEVALFDGDAEEPSRLLYRTGAVQAAGRDFEASRSPIVKRIPLEVAGHRFRVSLSAPTRSLLANRSHQARTVLAIGVSFTALFGALLLVLTGRMASDEGVVQQLKADLACEAAERAREAGRLRRSEAALRASEERHRMLADQSSDFIARHRLDGVLTYASSACRSLLGYEPEEMIGMSYFELVHPADVAPVHEKIRAAADAEPGIATVSYRVRRNDGSYVWLETTLRVLHDPLTQAPSEVLTASRDISERKRLEAMRQDLVGMLSHDLRNPLTAVLGFAEILRELPPDEPERDEFLGRIEANAHAALTLAMNFVDVSQIESGSLAPRLELVCLNETIERVLRRQESRARVKKIRLETHLDRSGPMALLDPRLIDRVIANLLNNAIKFSPSKSSVWVETAAQEGTVVVRVQDQGPGIPEDRRPELFRRFSELGSLRPDSWGLSLFIVKTLVNAQGGTVGAKFPPEGGTIFEIVFPAGSNYLAP